MMKKSMILITLLLLVIIFIFKDDLIGRNKLFTKEEINPSNIEQVEILVVSSQESIVFHDDKEISVFSNFFKKINSRNSVTANDELDRPLYFVYITNLNRNTNPTLTIFESSITYKGKKIDITSNELVEMIKILEDLNQ